MRAGGFLAAGAIREGSIAARFLRLAPGNLFVAFVAAACLEGGWPSVIGCICALLGHGSDGKGVGSPRSWIFSGGAGCGLARPIDDLAKHSCGSKGSYSLAWMALGGIARSDAR